VTKTQLADRLAAETGLSRIETRAVVEGLLALVVASVAAGEAVELRGFGTFRARALAARTARDPRTREPVEVPPRTAPAFRPAAAFRRAVEAGAPGSAAPR
jgi:nucleoid DNA-binding protein